jgi:glutathione S-transferase
MLSFVFEGAQISGSLQPFPNLISILERYHERAAYKAALEKGGEYKLGY